MSYTVQLWTASIAPRPPRIVLWIDCDAEDNSLTIHRTLVRHHSGAMVPLSSDQLNGPFIALKQTVTTLEQERFAIMEWISQRAGTLGIFADNLPLDAYWRSDSISSREWGKDGQLLPTG